MFLSEKKRGQRKKDEKKEKEWERWVKQQGTEAGFVEMAKTLTNAEDLISQKCLVVTFLFSNF